MTIRVYRYMQHRYSSWFFFVFTNRTIYKIRVGVIILQIIRFVVNGIRPYRCSFIAGTLQLCNIDTALYNIRRERYIVYGFFTGSQYAHTVANATNWFYPSPQWFLLWDAVTIICEYHIRLYCIPFALRAVTDCCC